MLSCVLPVNSNLLTLLFKFRYYYHNTYWLRSVALIPPSVTTPDPTWMESGAASSQVVPVVISKALQRKFYQNRELGKISEFRNTGFLLIK
ncbi:hypothetical protein HanRHA438_Chr17g0829571 [Helianthus annuus]|nr:hypothetical protein HanRHA438_Chr17g0829571 [Helianthus annuus]